MSTISNGSFNRHLPDGEYGNNIPGVQRIQQRMGQIDAEITALEGSKVVPKGFFSRPAMNTKNNDINRKIAALRKEQLEITNQMKTFLENERSKHIGAKSSEELQYELQDIIDEKGRLESSIAIRKSEKESADARISNIESFNQILRAKTQEMSDLAAKKVGLPAQIRRKQTEISKIKKEIKTLNDGLSGADATTSRAMIILVDQKELEQSQKEQELKNLNDEFNGIDGKITTIQIDLENQKNIILYASGFTTIRDYLDGLQNESDRLKNEIAPIQAQIDHQKTLKEEIERQRKLHEANNPAIVSINGELAGINADINVNNLTQTFRQKLLRIWRS